MTPLYILFGDSKILFCFSPFEPDSAYVCVCVCVCMLSHAQLSVTLWIVAHQAPLSMEFSRQEYWSGLPFAAPGESTQPRDQTQLSWVSCITRRFFIREAQQRLEFNSSQNGGMLPERHDSPSVLRRARTARVLPGGRAGSHTPTGKATPPLYEGWESPLGTAKQAQQAQRTTGRRPPRPGPTAANTGSGKTCVCNAVGALRCSQVRYTQNLNKRLAVT